MLSFFPTPYPGEWWYSVLCRYHLRSGNAKFQTTIRELFQGRPRAMIGAFFPNNTVYQLCSQLPSSFDINTMVLGHTPFLYYMRMYTVSQKEDFLKALCKGEATTPTYIWKTAGGKSQRLRYCPLCAKEDAAQYGEAYWHMLHQLPLVSVCDIHQCRLLDASSEPLRLNESFYPLTAPEAACGISVDGGSLEILLAKLSREYLEMDFKAGPTQKYNNLAQVLLNQGGVISLDVEKLYMQLSNFYGNAIVKRIFGSEASVATRNRIVKWNLSSPERYIMLQGLAGISIETMFSEVQIPDKMKLRLLDLQATGITYGKKQLAEQLGVKPICWTFWREITE